MQQDTGIVATGMTKHIEGGAEQLIEGNRLENKAKPAILVVVMGAFLTLPDEQRQTIAHVIQASHRREGVIDRRRHGSDGHFDELVDSVFDILGGVRWFPIWKALRICPSNPSSNRPAGQTRATTAPRLKK